MNLCGGSVSIQAESEVLAFASWVRMESGICGNI